MVFKTQHDVWKSLSRDSPITPDWSAGDYMMIGDDGPAVNYKPCSLGIFYQVVIATIYQADAV